MSEDEIDHALKNDSALREAIEKNRERAQAAGHVRAVPPELAAKVQRAQKLRVELAAFSSLPPVAQDAQTFKDKITEYVTVRLDLAVSMTLQEVTAELRISRADLDQLMRFQVEQAVKAEAKVKVSGGTIPSLEDRVLQLERLVSDLVP
jgi:hypothetical protein